MNSKLGVGGIAFIFAAVSLSPAASAQERRNYLEERVAAPTRAFELTVGTGYTQGFGSLESGIGLPTVSRAGIGVELGAGYRIDRRWMVGLAGQYQEFNAERASSARGMSGGLQVSYHLTPNNRIDPWLQFGAGYRMLWERNDAASLDRFTHGFEVGKLTAGLDMRVSRDVAIAPMVGAGADVFVWQRPEGGPTVAIADPRLSTFVFAGLQGRFDIGGARVGGEPILARR